jgi:hypothetical protein
MNRSMSHMAEEGVYVAEIQSLRTTGAGSRTAAHARRSGGASSDQGHGDNAYRHIVVE